MADVCDVPQGTVPEDRRRIIRDVATLLSTAETLHDPSSRQIFLRELNYAFGGEFWYQESAVFRPQLVELTTRCLERNGGLQTMAECLELLQPGGAETYELLRLADEWQVIQQFADHDIQWLRSDLSGRSLSAQLRRFAMEARGAAVPAHCESAWHLFAHLTSTNPLGGVPVWLRFLDLLRPLMSEEFQPRLGDLIAALNDEWGVVDQPGQETASSRSGSGSGFGTAYLVIQFEKYGGDEDTYIMSHWHQWASPVWQPIRGEDRYVSHDELEAAVDRIVYDTERGWADQVGPVTIEFVLPWQLLNDPVEQWRKELDSGRPSPLTAEYPLVIRSLERLRARQWHRLWRGRWQGVRGGVPASRQVYCASADQADVQLEALLKQEGGVVVLVLSESPTPSGVGERQLLAGVRSGVPAIIWHRGSPAPSDLCEMVTSMVNGAEPVSGVAELPRLVARLRQSAWAEAPSSCDHIGHGFVILWDDPERQPERTGSAGSDMGEIRA